uniref:Uncharacterized protein n=1 Tax=Haptolina brevifila TaxID=156173 RepID=A0A7S2IZ08_9EUKA
MDEAADTIFSNITGSPGALFAATYGTLTATHTSGTIMTICDSATGGGATTGGSPALCPILALAYATYFTFHLPETYFVGCNLIGTMNSDGTGSLNSGLFVRHTLREMLHGYDDPLFSVVPASAVPAGLDLEYNGLLGKFSAATSSLAEVRTDDLVDYQYALNGGSKNIADLGKWVSRQGVSTSTCSPDIFGKCSSGYYGWDVDGTPGQDFVLAGQRSLNTQQPSDETHSPMRLVLDDFKTSLASGTSITFFLSAVRRQVTIGCGSDGSTAGPCDYHSIDGIQTFKFEVPTNFLDTTLNGVANSACRGDTSYYGGRFPAPTGTPPSCDWMMRHNGVVNLETSQNAPVAATLGYLGHTDTAVRDAVSMTLPGSTDELIYDAANDELAIFVEPITGRVIRGYQRLQSNFYIDKTFINSARYANVFNSDTDNSDTFVWPFMYIKRSPTIARDQSKAFIDTLYGTYRLGFALDVIGIILFPLCLACGICCLQSAHKAAKLRRELPATAYANGHPKVIVSVHSSTSSADSTTSSAAS